MQRKNLSMRYPLRIPHGPSVPQMFSAESSMSVIAPFAEKTLNQRFLHEVSYRYGKLMTLMTQVELMENLTAFLKNISESMNRSNLMGLILR